jgi:hypothetical protein
MTELEHGYASVTSTPRFDLKIRDERKGLKAGQRRGPVNVQGVGEAQVAGLTRVFEKDGYSVTVLKRG